MAPMYLADYFTSSDIQCREQGGRTVPHFIVGTSLRDAACQRQYGLCAIERLNLALLVHVQRHGLERRVQVKPDDIWHLVDEHRIAGELERFLSMRLQAKSTPDS